MVNSTEEYVLHDSSERRPGSGRPSLLSADQAPAQQDHSILSQLDGRTAPARRPAAAAQPSHGRGARAVLLVVGIASIATMGWLALGSVSQSPDATMAATHAPAPVLTPARSVAAMPAAVAAAPVAADAAAEVPKPAALIRDDLTAAFDPLPPSAEADRKGLSDTLALAPSPAATPEKQDLASLLDAPAPAPPAAVKPGKPAPVPADAPPKDKVKNKPAAERLARADKPRTATAPAKPKAPSKPAPKKPAPAVDTDVALLAALLAHTKTPAAGSAEDIFKRCATNATADEVHRCRVRVCQGSAKGAAECKSVRISKVSS